MPWIIGGAILGAGVIGSMSSAEAAEDTNRANIEQSHESRIFNAEQAALNREFSSAEATRQMDFQQAMASLQYDRGVHMSGTAYQRAVADMKKAGLSPMLAYSQGPASSAMPSVPSGAAGSPVSTPAAISPQIMPVNKWSGFGSAAQTAASVIGEGVQAERSAQLIDSEKALLDAQTTASLSSAGHMDAQRDSIRQEMQSFEQRMKKLGHETTTEYYKSVAEKFKAGILSSEDLMATRYFTARAAEMEKKAQLLGLEVPEAVANAAMWASEFGKALPYGEHGTKLLGNIGGALRNLPRRFR